MRGLGRTRVCVISVCHKQVRSVASNLQKNSFWGREISPEFLNNPEILADSSVTA